MLKQMDRRVKLCNGRDKQKWFAAVLSGSTSLVEGLLHQGTAFVNQPDNSGKTAIFYAIVNHNRVLLKMLLKSGAIVNQPSYVAYHRDNQLCSCSEPPLVTATRLGDRASLALLLQHGANVDTRLDLPKQEDLVLQDKTALHLACEDVRLDVVIELMDRNADVNLEDRTGELPVHKIVRCRDCAKQCEILRLLCEHGSDVNWTNKIECSPLYVASFYGCSRKVEILVLYGAEINKVCARENSYGTALHIAAAKDRPAITDILLTHGAILDMLNGHGCTPLQLNVNSLSVSDIAFTLISHGAQVNGTDKWGFSLMAACIRNMRLDCEPLAQLLVHAGYDLSLDVWLIPAEERRLGEDEEVPDIPIPAGRVERLCDWLRWQRVNPMSLIDKSRNVIRGCLRKAAQGTSIWPQVQRMPLPTPYKDLLMLREYLPQSN